MTRDEMIERVEHVLEIAKMMPSKERADVGTLVAAIERELPPLLADLRSRPTPPDALGKLAKKWRDEADRMTAMGWSQQAAGRNDGLERVGDLLRGNLHAQHATTHEGERARREAREVEQGDVLLDGLIVAA